MPKEKSLSPESHYTVVPPYKRKCFKCDHHQFVPVDGTVKWRCVHPTCNNYQHWTPIVDNNTPPTIKDPKARYYDAGGLETLDIIQAKLTPEQYKGWLLGNIIKYSCRVNWKDQMDRDIEKIDFYGSRLVEIKNKKT